LENFRFRQRRPNASFPTAAPIKLKNGAGRLDRLLDGYRLTAKSEGRSSKTISWVTSALNYFVRFLTENDLSIDIAHITSTEIKRYVVHLQQQPRYSSHPFTPEQPELLSEASVNSYIRGLQSFWAWLVRDGFLTDSPFNHLRIPVAPFRIKPPLSREQIAAMLYSCDQSDPLGYRDYAVMFLLYDTGVRAAELCYITLEDIYFEERQVRVLGKGNKQRLVPIGANCQKYVWKYQQFFRPEPNMPNIEQLFLTDEGYPLKVDSLQDIIKRHAKKAGLTGIQVSPHAFRRAFAVDYLRNGGDVLTLKEILGHTTLAMMRVYVSLARKDVAKVHARCSPGDNLDLQTLKPPGGSNRKPKGGDI
jgi:site-specific recombinase XerD